MLVERLKPQNFCAVIIADPERHRGCRIIHEHAAYVGRPRQQVFHRVPGSRIETQHPITGHAAAPQLAVFVDGNVIRVSVRGRHVPFLERLRLDVEHGELVGGKFREPEPALIVEHGSSRA